MFQVFRWVPHGLVFYFSFRESKREVSIERDTKTQRMVFLGELVNLFGRRLFLGRAQAYGSFTENVDEAGNVLREPRENWLLGFTDQKLEDKYLENLARKKVSKTRIWLGYVLYLTLDTMNIISWLVILYSPKVPSQAAMAFANDGDEVDEIPNWESETLVVQISQILLYVSPLLVGLAMSLVIGYCNKIKKKVWLFHVTEFCFTVQMALKSYAFGKWTKRPPSFLLGANGHVALNFVFDAIFLVSFSTTGKSGKGALD